MIQDITNNNSTHPRCRSISPSSQPTKRLLRDRQQRQLMESQRDPDIPPKALPQSVAQRDRIQRCDSACHYCIHRLLDLLGHHKYRRWFAIPLAHHNCLAPDASHLLPLPRQLLGARLIPAEPSTVPGAEGWIGIVGDWCGASECGGPESCFGAWGSAGRVLSSVRGGCVGSGWVVVGWIGVVSDRDGLDALLD